MTEPITTESPLSDSLPSGRTAAVKLVAACALFALAVGTVFGDVLFRNDVVLSLINTDTWRQFYPWRMFGFTELAHGHVALWNPYIFSGAPYLGGFQAALFYPPNWIFMILPVAVAINLSTALHIFLAGVFMYCWTAYRRLHWAACVSAGLIFMFSGPVFGRIVAGHIAHIDTLIWAPLVFLAVDDLTATRSLRGALLGSAAFAMQIFAGHAQYAFYTAVAGTIYFAINLYSAPSCGRAIGGYFLCFGGGALIAAVQLFTGLGAIAEAMRSHTEYVFASTFSFPPENLLTTIMPGFFGDVLNVPYWGRWFWWETSAYVGVVGLMLACFALAAPRKSRRFAIVMALVILAISLGKYTPLFHILYRLPGFSSFRGIDKIIFLMVMFLALLAGIGLDQILRTGIKRVWPVAGVALASLLLLIAAAIVDPGLTPGWHSPWGRVIGAMPLDKERTLLQSVDLSFVYSTGKLAAAELCRAGIIGLLLSVILMFGRMYWKVLFAIPVLLAFELILFATSYQPTFSLDRYQRQIDAVKQCLGPLPPHARVWAFDEGQLLMAGRLNSWGDDPMMLRRYVEFMADAIGVEPSMLMIGRPPFPSKTLRLPRLVRMAGVMYMDRQGPHLVKFDAPILPRADLVGTVRVEPDRAGLLSAMNDPRFDPLHTALVESPIEPTPSGATDPGKVTVRDIDSDTLDIEAAANSPCLLLITDSYSAGWHADALPDSDQRQYQVIPADLTLRGVPLIRGHHHFRLVYRPTAFVVGKWTSIAAMMAYFVLAATSLRRRSPFRFRRRVGYPSQSP